MTAVALLALAAALAFGVPQRAHLRRLEPRGVAVPAPVAMAPLALVGVGLCCVWLLFGTAVLGWVVILAMVGATVVWLVQGSRRDRRCARGRNDAARASRTLALLLEAGEIPASALRAASSDSPILCSVAATSRLGGDVAAAFAHIGAEPGGEGFRRVSAAWSVSEQTGAPISVVLSRVAGNLRRERHLLAVVTAELAPARAGGRIMAMLPFVAISLGSLVGANPLRFLLGSGPGEVALLAGTALAATGVVWTERIARSGVSAGEPTS